MANCDESGMREECGVFGCVSVDTDPASLDVPAIIATGLTGLQHRLLCIINHYLTFDFNYCYELKVIFKLTSAAFICSSRS